jgi:hypothetical protein
VVASLLFFKRKKATHTRKSFKIDFVGKARNPIDISPSNRERYHISAKNRDKGVLNLMKPLMTIKRNRCQRRDSK